MVFLIDGGPGTGDGGGAPIGIVGSPLVLNFFRIIIYLYITQVKTLCQVR